MVHGNQALRIRNTIVRLLSHYSFDHAEQACDVAVAQWLSRYPHQWVMDAVVEALYQGRYKTVSVDQILIVWQRRGAPIRHFNHEFERIVCDRLLERSSATPASTTPSNATGNTSGRATVPSSAAVVDVSSTPPSSPTGVDHRTPTHSSGTPPQARPVLGTPTPATPETHPMAPAGEQTSTTAPPSASLTPSAPFIVHDSLGQDGRLSEILERLELPSEQVDAIADPRSSPGRPPHDSPQTVQHLHSSDPEASKVPLPSFEPQAHSSTYGAELQQVAGTLMRYCPIHEFQPAKAPVSLYKKLCSIAHQSSTVPSSPAPSPRRV